MELNEVEGHSLPIKEMYQMKEHIFPIFYFYL